MTNIEKLKISLAISLFAKVALAFSAVTPAKLKSFNSTLTKQYPYSMLTPDYGIITTDDLAADRKTYRLIPYSPANNWSAAYWQCFPTSSVWHKYETWRDHDPMGPETSIITLCSLETRATRDGQWHYYHGRRAQPVEYCREFIKNWKKLTTKESIVCFSGEAGGLEKTLEKGMSREVHLWTWNKFKTKKGCYAYFDDCVP